jgi:hypothetical protein
MTMWFNGAPPNHDNVASQLMRYEINSFAIQN